MPADHDPLYQRASLLCKAPAFQQLIRRLCPYLDPARADHLNLAIPPGDQMLRHSLNIHQDANAAFGQYYNVALQQHFTVQQILHQLFPEAPDKVRVLDFACGYGRLLRFLSLSLPVAQIRAAEIQPDALAYVRSQFGVQTLASVPDPNDFQPVEKFQLIWVASLFSHLPDRLFSAWIARLRDCLAPDGVLCFSVHDACLLPPDYALPDTGILFLPSSENTDLDTSIYGTTFVNEDYVARTLRQVCGDNQGYFRLPRALAHEQDIYVLPANAKRDLSQLANVRRGPWGWTDERWLNDAGELYLRGWAASIDDGPLASISIEIDDQSMECPTGRLREDVARAFDDPRLARSGWEFRYRPPKGTGDIRVAVIARTTRGEQALLYAGLLERPASLQSSGNWWTRVKQRWGI